VTDAEQLRALGTSPRAIARHYDVSDDYFATWLGPDLVYSCALWDPADADDTLDAAQRRKLDYFATRLDVGTGRVLDVGCGWGALLARFVDAHGVRAGAGITLSAAQQRYAERRGVPGVSYAVESWVDHAPRSRYDAITCIEATEHFASDRAQPAEKVAVYEAFFERCADWLRAGGRVGLQLICQDNAGHAATRPGRGRMSELIRLDIFPESMPAALSELVLAWEPRFALETLLEHHDHYRRTFRAWALAYRASRGRARSLVPADTADAFERYFTAGEVLFRLREHTLYRVVLRKRSTPKRWATPRAAGTVDAAVAAPTASGPAVRAHYDVSNDFYQLWLGRTMQYTSAMWDGPDDPSDLDTAHARKLDYFADRCVPPAARVLDVGCGWGGNLRHLVARRDVAVGVGLTLSAAQHAYVDAAPIPRTDVRVESWRDHHPTAAYDAILSYGAFEHFAPDGTPRAQRIATYREFFASCHEWLTPGGRIGLETIANDDAPDVAGPRGRGPLAQAVLDVYPESICPHLHEVVLGFEPYFELEVLRAVAADFARTARHWHTRLRACEDDAVRLVGADVTTRFRRYLVATEVQFRVGLITNYRFVLRRRAERVS
jgi:cyclopropane-fatty-acyl-phospholipid synthase